MIFPQLSPEYYDEGDKEILGRMEAFYAESITINQSFWSEADTDTRFETGDQTLWNDIYGNLPANRRQQFNFNRIRRVVNMIGGHQRRNRKSTIVIPSSSGSEDTADQFTKLMYWVNNQESVLETISDSFHGALVTGMNLLHVWMDYRTDPLSGNIKVDNCSYNSFLIDPFFRKHDLSDCRAIWKRSFLSKRECISLMPNRANDILGLIANSAGTGRDGKFQFMPESYGYSYQNFLTYDEYYYRDYRSQKILIDSQTGDTLEWKGDDEMLARFLEQYPQVKAAEQEIPTVRVAIVIQGKVMYDGPNPLGIDEYPFVPVFAYYNPQMPYFPWRVQGVVRGLRDAQYLYNRRKIIELDILESQRNSGFMAKENALVNPNDMFVGGQGTVLLIKEEAQMTDVQQIPPPSIPPSMIELSKIMAQEIQEISGINEELLGSATDDKPGILSMLRQGAGLTTLQILFDQLDKSQKHLGSLILKLIQSNFSPGKVQRIIKEQPSQEFYSKAFGCYDSSIEEGFNTTTQKQLEFAQLLQLREAGVPIPNSALIETATVQNKKILVEQIEAQEKQQQQMQQMQVDGEMKEQMSRIKLTEARAVADEGLGVERYSRVKENEALAVERQAAARKDDDEALLTMVKALKEIDDIDITHVHKLISLAAMLKSMEQQGKENEQPTPQPQPQTSSSPVLPGNPEQAGGQTTPTGI